jgi:hypothetical protein
MSGENFDAALSHRLGPAAANLVLSAEELPIEFSR